MKPRPFVLLPIALLLVVSVSGCTIPGLEGFCIPGLTCGGGTVEYENDVLIIKTLDAIPQTISTGQQLRLSAWITNNGAETVPQKFEEANEGYTAYQNIKVQLYDTCEGLFQSIVVQCPPDSAPTDDKRGCWVSKILSKQTIPVSWTLAANDNKKIPLETSCNLKVYVEYPYRTKSITSVSFVDYTEYQRMIDEGKFTPITSYITEGYGPIKPYLTVEDSQPIPVRNGIKSTFAMAFQIKNKGSGFLSGYFVEDESKQNDIINVPQSHIKIESNANTNYDLSEKIQPEVQKIGDIQLIGGKESPKQSFPIAAPTDNQVEKIATYYVTTSIDYMYEFRKEIKVTIKPPAITG